MPTRTSRAWLACLTAVALAGGCNCGKRSSSGTGGLLGNGGILTPKPVALNFGNVPVGQSASLQLTLTNDGDGELDIDGQTISGDPSHVFSAKPFATSFAVRQSRTGLVTFAPTQAGPVLAQLVFENDGLPASVSVPLQGTGIAVDVACTPSVMDFGPVQVGVQPSPTQTFTCTNNGTTAAFISVNAASTAPQFLVTDANGPVSAANQDSIGPGGRYIVTVAFAPTSVGNIGSAFAYTLCEDVQTCVAPQSVTLSGQGVNGALQISPNPITYAGVPAGQKADQTVTLTNTGNGSLDVTCISLDSVGATACGSPSAVLTFSGLPTLPATLMAGQSVTFTLQYDANGSALTDQLDVAYAPPGVADAAQATAPISATSSAAPCSLTLSPPTLYFGWATVGQLSTLASTLTNRGTSTCNISGVALNPTSDPSYSVDSRQATSFSIAAGASAQITVDFTLDNNNPPNQRTGAVDFNSDDPNLANGSIALLASLETVGSTCPDDHPNLFTGQTDQGGTCQSAADCTAGLTCTNSACWLLGETSPIQIVLSWDYAEDLDLHVVEPQAGGPDSEKLPDGGSEDGCEIFYGNGTPQSGDPDCTPAGALNRDAQAACYAEDVNVEEVTYAAGKLPPAGWYTVRADFYDDCDSTTGQRNSTIPYVVQVRIGGFLESYCGTFTRRDADVGYEGAGVQIFQFEILPDGGML